MLRLGAIALDGQGASSLGGRRALGPRRSRLEKTLRLTIMLSVRAMTVMDLPRVEAWASPASRGSLVDTRYDCRSKGSACTGCWSRGRNLRRTCSS